ncbi:hypothetical protein RHSIM_Rhsim09G0186400 [Rhododendron simsii]|uniref:Mediator of RNA polymerase II transcription subunit 28 n=1 Tax=Rhododendron simsii TaxID=118357 RepID=A0A834GIJ9_RHOSS|nr:hypothetical protein RHSIM_Rhsim09G0186400 [Rhododendron simsii]
MLQCRRKESNSRRRRRSTERSSCSIPLLAPHGWLSTNVTFDSLQLLGFLTSREESTFCSPMDPQHPLDPQLQSASPPREDMIACVMALEAALLPCLPARELQAIDRSPHPSHQRQKSYETFGWKLELGIVDVERHARDFMEAAKKLQLYFVDLERDDQPTKAETLRKLFMFALVCNEQEIAVMEEELKIKSELIKKQERLIQGWRKELKDQLDKHNTELERV